MASFPVALRPPHPWPKAGHCDVAASFSVLRETPMTSAIHFKKLKCCKKWQRSREVHRRVPKQGNRAGVDPQDL